MLVSVFEEGSRTQGVFLHAQYLTRLLRCHLLSSFSSSSRPLGNGVGGRGVRVLLFPKEFYCLICVTCEAIRHDHQIGCFSGLVVGNQFHTEIQPEGKVLGQR